MKNFPVLTRAEYLSGDVTPLVRATLRRMRLDFGDVGDLQAFHDQGAIDDVIVPPVVPSRGYTARAYHSSDITIPDNVWTPVTTLDSERWDDGVVHSVVANTGRLTCQSAGKYIITGGIEWAIDDTSGHRGLAIILNGTTQIAATMTNAGSYGYNAQSTVGTIYQLEADDYVELCVFQSTPGTHDLVASAQRSPELSMVKTT